MQRAFSIYMDARFRVFFYFILWNSEAVHLTDLTESEITFLGDEQHTEFTLIVIYSPR